MEPLAQAKSVLERHLSRLMAYPNVTSVGVGHRVIQGIESDEVCISVTVSRKLVPTVLKASELLPDVLDGIPVDVVESGTFQPLSPSP